MNKFKNFIYKYKVTISIILLLGASFLIYFFVSANVDPYENKIKVKSTNVTIEDGTRNLDGYFDKDDSPGNDSSDSNHVVRNFDSITYNIEYELGFKEDSDDDISSDTTRNVIVDVLIPKNLNVDVTSELSSTPEGYVPKNVTVDGKEYKHYELKFNDASLINSNTINVVLSNINSKSGTNILPIIRVRESTDKSAESLENIKNILSDSDAVVVTAVDKLEAKLYAGTIKSDKTTGITGIPVGIVLYVPSDENKGMKGIQVPTSKSYNLDVRYTEGTGNISYLDRGNYDESKFTIPNLPASYNDGKNANIGYSEINTTDGYNKTFKIDFEDIKFNTNTVDLNLNVEDQESNIVTYVSSNVFAINSEKTVNEDATLEFKLENSTVQILDNYEPFVGDYLSKIDFISESNSEFTASSGIQYETPGEASYNYNEEFYIQDTITYGEKSGDVLNSGLTNYVKIDNSMVKLIDIGNIQDQTLEYYLRVTSSNEKQNTDTTSDIYNVSYGIGEWIPTNFKIKSGAPKYCPKSTSNLTKEQLMNYYGGPCIEEVENSIKWYDSIESAASEDENNRDKVIIFKYDFKEKYYPGTKTIIRLKARMISNPSNVGKTTQVVARGTTIDDDSLYYLSGIPRKSVSILDNDLNYIKTEYNSDTKEIVEGTNVPSGRYGNTILVTPFKVGLNDIEIRDKYDSLKNTIYSGITDPVSINITPVLYKSDMNATFTSATVTLYLPVELELSVEKQDKSLTYIGEETVNDRKYNKYQYTYSEDDIKYGTASVVDSLVVHAYIDISAADLTVSDVIASVDATMKPNIDATTIFSSINSIKSRTKSASITLRNTNVISTIGKMNSSVYFEKNGEMNYNMRAANLSGSSANLSLVKVIPYSEDAIGEGSEFSGNISVRLESTLPSGYEVYYTKENSKTILSNELNASSSNKWVKWSNYTTNTAGITAIKIVSTSPISNNGYFASKNGINIIMKTSENNEGDEYYNNFYVLYSGENANITPVASNITYASVYNRSISGYVFEDYDYDGFYNNSERRLSDIPVEVYKSTSSDGNYSDDDELIFESTTDKNGYYNFKGLQQGKYYIKYTYDCDKYTLTEKNKVDVNLGDTSQIDSDAQTSSGTCEAVSNMITLDNNYVNVRHIDMGLRIRQNFGVEIKKYITNVVVNSNRGTNSYDYDKQTKVKIDVKNLKNTSFRVTYEFEISNSKYFPGTIGTIIETIPEGMTFDSTLAANDGWYESDGHLYYTKLAQILILPDEKYYMTVVLDLKTDNGGTYVNFVAAQNLKVMNTTMSILDGIEILDYVKPSNNDNLNKEEE